MLRCRCKCNSENGTKVQVHGSWRCTCSVQVQVQLSPVHRRCRCTAATSTSVHGARSMHGTKKKPAIFHLQTAVFECHTLRSLERPVDEDGVNVVEGGIEEEAA